jgi:hypothetical protein
MGASMFEAPIFLCTGPVTNTPQGVIQMEICRVSHNMAHQLGLLFKAGHGTKLLGVKDALEK